MKICIRADGGKNIGMGHIVRTVALANKLKENGHSVFFVCRIDGVTDKYSEGIKLIKLQGFKVVTIEEQHLKKEIKNIKADCILTDSYDVDEEYFNIIKPKFLVSGCIYDRDCKYIDKFNVDFFVNPDLYAIKENYKIVNYGKKLLGNKYIILRETFLKCKNFKVHPNLENILITLGGGNSCSYINKILTNVINLKQYNFYVILGPGVSCNNRDKLKKAYSIYNNIKILHNVNDIWNIMLKCDLAISSCGTTLYELMYLGIPTIGVVSAENQIVMGEYLRKNNIVKICRINSIQKMILELSFFKRKKMNLIFQKIVDGKGVDRIVEIIVDLYNRKVLEDKYEKSDNNPSKNGF